VLFGGFSALVLMLAAPFLLLGLFALIAASLARPSEETAARIARERFVRGEIDKEQLGVLLRSL
jgi:uncharacterized membrane protein